MKLLRYGAPGEEKPGLLDQAGHIRDLSGHIADIAADVLSSEGLARLATLDPDGLPIVGGQPRLGPCVGAISKIVCVGLNYSDHAAETNSPIPGEPILFMKAISSITGPNDGIMLPRGSMHTDWEIELGVVIGKKAQYVSEEEALDYVAGYCLVNDVSERNYQTERCGQWTKGKSCDTFAPIGPWLVTKDEVPDQGALDMALDVNGRRRQTGNTRTMIFGVCKLVSYISEFMTLMPGDLISTGTPPGVGQGQKPPTYLREGDLVELTISGLGSQRQTVSAWRGPVR